MQIELKIRDILGKQESVKDKADEICKFMNWNKKKLITAIIKHGTTVGDQQSAIIKEFWGNLSKK